MRKIILLFLLLCSGLLNAQISLSEIQDTVGKGYVPITDYDPALATYIQKYMLLQDYLRDSIDWGIGTLDLYQVLTNGNDAGGLDAINFAEVEADEFIGDLRGAVLFKAQAGENLLKGEVVYVSGISGNTTIVSKADADDANKMPAFGVVAVAANSGNPVDIYTFGTLSNLNTSGFTLGDILYVSTTAGQLTATPPTGESSLIQNIAKVTRVHASSGSIKISGAGRTNATPNLNTGRLFVGNASNQAVADGTIYVDIANSRVGIGTSSPDSKLEIQDGYSHTDLSGLSSASGRTALLTTISSDNDLVTWTVSSDGVGVADRFMMYSADLSTEIFRLSYDQNSWLNLGGGNLGIGTNSPSAKLDVNGDVEIVTVNTDNTTDDILVHSSDGTVSKRTLTSIGDEIDLNLGDDNLTVTTAAIRTLDVSNSNRFSFVGSQQNITISDEGYLGVNYDFPNRVMQALSKTNSFQETFLIQQTGSTGVAEIRIAHTQSQTDFAALSIGMSSTGATYIQNNKTDTNAGLNLTTVSTTGDIKLRTQSTDRVIVDQDGNVGIGTTSPSAKLHVYDVSPRIRLQSSSTGTLSSGIIDFYDNTSLVTQLGLLSTSNSDFDIFHTGANAIDFWTNSTHAVRIDANQRVGIGTTSPSSTLDIIGDIQVSDLPTDDGATKMVAWGVDGRLKSTTLYTHSRIGVNGAGADLNDMTDYSSVSSADPKLNTPFGASWYNLINIRHRGGISDGYKYGGQIAFGMTNYRDRIAFRAENNGTWDSWKELYHTDNITDVDVSTLDLTNYWQKSGSDLYYNSGNIGIGTSSPSSIFNVEYDDVGGGDGLTFKNTNTASSANAVVAIINGGTTGGDPITRYNLVGEGSWYFGADNDNSNVLYANWNSSGVNELELDNAGNLSIANTLTINSDDPSNKYSLPANDGTANQYLKTDGSGNVTWSTIAGSTDDQTLSEVLTSGNDAGNLGAHSFDYISINSSNTNKALEIQASGNDRDGILIYDSSTSSVSPYLEIRGKRSDNNTSQVFAGGVALARLHTTTYVGTSQNLGSIYFGGNHTDSSESNLLYAASISAEADGNFTSATNMPTRLVFRTNPSGTTGRALETANVDFGVDRMVIDSDGNVGIGTLTPSNKLHVLDGSNEARFGNITGVNYIQGLFKSSASSGGIRLENSTGYQWEVQSLASQDKFIIYDRTAAEFRLVIDNSGNTGIGLINPSQKLHVAGNIWTDNTGVDREARIFNSLGEYSILSGSGLQMSRTSASLIIPTGDRTQILSIGRGVNEWNYIDNYFGTLNRYYYQESILMDLGSNGLRMYDSSTNNDIRLNPNGDSYIMNNLGIGTTSPSVRLYAKSSTLGTLINDELTVAMFEVSGGNRINLEYSAKRLAAGSSWYNTEQKISFNIDENASKDVWIKSINSTSTTDNILAFGEGTSTEWMRIDNGNVGIGTNSPSHELDVNGDVLIQDYMRIGGTGTSNDILMGVVNFTNILSVSNYPFKIDLTTASEDFIIETGAGSNIQAVTVDGATGNVGLTQSNPSAKLDVVGDTELNGSLIVDNGVIDADAITNNISMGSSTVTVGDNTTLQLKSNIGYNTIQFNGGSLRFSNGTTEHLNILSDGDLDWSGRAVGELFSNSDNTTSTTYSKIDFTVEVMDLGDATPSTANDDIELNSTGYYNVEIVGFFWNDGDSSTECEVALFRDTTEEASVAPVGSKFTNIIYKSPNPTTLMTSKLMSITALQNLSVQFKRVSGTGTCHCEDVRLHVSRVGLLD